MGILNRTCSISNTPIVNGQNVRIFFLASCRGKYQQQSAQFSSLPSHFIPDVYSQYNMIGGIGLKAVADDEETCFFSFDHESFEAKHILRKIKQSYHMLTNEDIDNKKSNSMANKKSINIKEEDLDFEKVLNLIEKGDLYLKSIIRSDVFNSVSIMAVHEEVYQMLINDHQKEYVRDEGYVDMTFDYFLNKEKVRFEEWEKSNEILMQKRIESFSSLSDKKLEKKDIEKIIAGLVYMGKPFGESYESSYSFNGANPHNNMLLLKIETGDDISKEEILMKATEEKFFIKKMNEYNLMLRPTITSGDERDYDIFVGFYDKMKNVVSSIMEKEEGEY